MSTSNNHFTSKSESRIDTFNDAETSTSKFWRKVKEDPVVPIGMAGFGLIVLGAIIGYNRRDRSKPTSTYWIRTRVYAQGFVVSLLTAAAIYQAVKATSEPHDIHGHPLNHPEGSGGHHHHHHTHHPQHSKN